MMILSKRQVKRLQKIFRVVALVGFVCLWGSFAAADHEYINTAQLIVYALVSFATFCIGCLFGGLIRR